MTNRPDENRTDDTEHQALEQFATGDLVLGDSHEDRFLQEAAVLKGNALGIIYDGDGSSHTEKVQRMLMLVPALLTVVDEARDTIGRLREDEETTNRRHRLFIKGSTGDIRDAVNRAKYQAAAASGAATWQITAVSDGLCEVALVVKAEPGRVDGVDFMFVLSELKTEIETGEPISRAK